MEPVLGNHSLRDWQTAVTEHLTWQDGRLTRTALIRAMLRDKQSADNREQSLDAVASCLGSDGIPLYLRPGRVLTVRLRVFRRERHAAAPSAAFTLELEALHPWEESDTEAVRWWQVTGTGAVGTLYAPGTAPAPLRLEFVAEGGVLQPEFSDGVRSLRYDGSVPDGETLVLDGPASKVLVAGDDETAYTRGDFPVAIPGETTVYFGAAPEGAAQGSVHVRWRDRWY